MIRKLFISLLVVIALVFFAVAYVRQSRTLITLESKVNELEQTTTTQMEAIRDNLRSEVNREIQALKEMGELLQINDTEFSVAQNEALEDLAMLLDEKDELKVALEERAEQLETMNVRLELLEINEDQHDQLEVLLYLDEEKRGMQVLRSSMGTRLMVQLVGYEVNEDDGVLTAKLLMINPEGGMQRGIKFLTRAYTHQLAADLSDGNDQKPFTEVEADIDLQPGTQTELELFVPWVESDSPLEALQLRGLTLDFYGYEAME